MHLKNNCVVIDMEFRRFLEVESDPIRIVAATCGGAGTFCGSSEAWHLHSSMIFYVVEHASISALNIKLSNSQGMA